MKTQRIVKGAGRAASIALGAAAAVAFLTACGNKDSTTEAKSAASAPAVVSSPPQAVTPVPSPAESIARSSPPAAVPVAPAPEDLKRAWREGVALFDAGDHAGAAGRLKVAALGEPDRPYAHYLLGLALWKSGQTEEAERELERASTLDGKSLKTWINLARVRLDRGDARGGLDAAEAALAIDPASANALHQRGRALLSLRRGDEAVETLTSARHADPENGFIANSLGYALIQTGHPAEALAHLAVAGDKLPNVDYVHNNLGVAYERLGRTDEAVQEYRMALDAGDKDGKAAASLARLGPVVRPALARRESVPPADPGAGTAPPVAQVTPPTGGPDEEPQDN